ncbi:MAG: hypothetical protein L6Q71_04600 [Planctomycetes bacterium]|nr:hypothetical protein [Planctomycetota bacterium]NUQ35942.1 hypothetical protein [Planctomycetaceae bacterium]
MTSSGQTWLSYVIQCHTWQGMDHFDFMFEWPGSDMLRTFQLPEPPERVCVETGIACREIAPHRRDYLEYEGEVSRDRGSVAIWDKGLLRLARDTGKQLEIELHSNQGREHPPWLFHFTGGSGWFLFAPRS